MFVYLCLMSCVRVYEFVSLCVFVCLCVCVCMLVCLYVFVFVCVNVLVCLCVMSLVTSPVLSNTQEIIPFDAPVSLVMESSNTILRCNRKIC